MAPIGAVDTFCINELQQKAAVAAAGARSSLPVQFPGHREKYSGFTDAGQSTIVQALITTYNRQNNARWH
jgi:hypothetical protein